MNKVVAVVGLCGSGKSEAVKRFVDAGFARVYFGTPTFTWLKEKGLPVSEANERMARETLRKQYGMAAFAILSIDAVRENLTNGNVVIESMYSWEEFKVIRDAFGDQFSVVALHTDKQIRYSRLTTRKVRPLTLQESISRDLAEIEISNKAGPIAFADYFVINDGELPELLEKIDKIIARVQTTN